MLIEFVVDRPLSVNRMYARRARGYAGKQLFLTPEGRDWKDRVHISALLARPKGWPKLDTIAHVRLSYQLFDYRGDTDGPRKALRDALEGVLYLNDRIVEDGPAPLPVRDGGGRRVRVTVEILATKEVQK